MGSPATAPTGKVFISYRRQDGAWPAASLYERISGRFGKDQVFKDVDSIDLGKDFVAEISGAVARCDVLVAVIGPKWTSLKGPGRIRRLDDPDDFVRLEIKAALERDVVVIPVLVDGARMPAADELPADIASLVQRQAMVLDPARFVADSDKLLRALDRTLGTPTPSPEAIAPNPGVALFDRFTHLRRSRRGLAIVGGAGGGALVLLTVLVLTLTGGVPLSKSAPSGTWRMQMSIQNVGGAYTQWGAYKNGIGSSYPATQAELQPDCTGDACKIKVRDGSTGWVFWMTWNGKHLSIQLPRTNPVEGFCRDSNGREMPDARYSDAIERAAGPAQVKMTGGVVTAIEFNYSEAAKATTTGRCETLDPASAEIHVEMTPFD